MPSRRAYVYYYSNDDFAGFEAQQGLEVSSGASQPRGERVVQGDVPPAPEGDVSGSRGRPSHSLSDHRWSGAGGGGGSTGERSLRPTAVTRRPVTPTSTPEWVSGFHSVLCVMRDDLAHFSASHSSEPLRRPSTGSGVALTDSSRIPVREGRFQSEVTLSPSHVPDASPSPSGVRVLARGERVHRLTESDVHSYSRDIRDTEYAHHRPTHISTNESSLPSSGVRPSHMVRIRSVHSTPLSSVTVPSPEVGVRLPTDAVVHDVRDPSDPRAGGHRSSMIDVPGQLIGVQRQLLAVRVPSGHVFRRAYATPRVHSPDSSAELEMADFVPVRSSSRVHSVHRDRSPLQSVVNAGVPPLGGSSRASPSYAYSARPATSPWLESHVMRRDNSSDVRSDLHVSFGDRSSSGPYRVRDRMGSIDHRSSADLRGVHRCSVSDPSRSGGVGHRASVVPDHSRSLPPTSLGGWGGAACVG